MKNIWIGFFSTLFLLVLTAVTLVAADDTPAAPPARSGGGRGNWGGGEGRQRRGGGGNFMQSINQFMEQLKTKSPNEAAELQRLMQADPRSAMEKARTLAQKYDIPFGNRGGRSRGGDDAGGDTLAQRLAAWQTLEAAVKEKFPAEYAEIEKLRIENPKEATAKLKELAAKADIPIPEGEPPVQNLILPRNLNRLVLALAAGLIQERYPEDYAAMVALRETDPDAARDRFRALVKQARLDYPRLQRMVIYGRNRRAVEEASGNPAATTAPTTNDATANGGNGGSTRRQLPTDIGDAPESTATEAGGPPQMPPHGGMMPPGPPPGL